MNILFDLDGTLWKTDDSYVYSYHKLVEKYKIGNPVSDSVVLSYLGVKLDKLAADIFKDFDNKEEIAKDAVLFSIEYITNNLSKSIEANTPSILRKLSKENNLFIVSNCPKIYALAFLKLTGLDDLNIKCLCIEDGSKLENVTSIISNSEERSILFGDSKQDYDSIYDHYKCGFVYADYGYGNADEYDYRISSFNEVIDIISKVVTKNQMLVNKQYKVISCNDSNVTIINNNNDTYYFGFVNVSHNDDDLVMINKLKEEVKLLKTEIIGPMNGNTFYSYRFAIDEFDLKFYPDCTNDEYTYRLFADNGFTIKQQYSSTIATMNQRIYDLSSRITLSKDYNIKIVSGKECFKYIDQLYDVTIDAFATADYYEKISREAFKNIYMQSISLVNPDLVLVFYNDELIGYNFCFEDLENRFYVSKTLAIKKKHQKNLRIMSAIVYHSYNLMMKHGNTYALHQFQNDRTKTAQSIHNGCAVRKKHYALLRYKYEK